MSSDWWAVLCLALSEAQKYLPALQNSIGMGGASTSLIFMRPFSTQRSSVSTQKFPHNSSSGFLDDERGASPQRAVTSEQQSQPPKGPTDISLIFAIKH
jgi:hypothetical protein